MSIDSIMDRGYVQCKYGSGSLRNPSAIDFVPISIREEMALVRTSWGDFELNRSDEYRLSADPRLSSAYIPGKSLGGAGGRKSMDGDSLSPAEPQQGYF
jgi:hypothetical protein